MYPSGTARNGSASKIRLTAWRLELSDTIRLCSSICLSFYTLNGPTFTSLPPGQPPYPAVSKLKAMLYRWRSLDRTRKGIRVLDLDAGTNDAPLSGQLRHVFLDESEKPCYDTISYAWIDTALVTSILVEGECVPIPMSAASALRCMRSRNTELTLWIDCICIAQNDDREKGHQIELMADIFQNSRATLAFLGNDNNTAKRAFDGLAMIYDAIKDSTGGTTELEQVTKVQLHNWDALRGEIDLSAISGIFAKPYFE
jgi:hypothetical protein